MSEKYQSCLVEKLELKGTIKEYEKAMTTGLARYIMTNMAPDSKKKT